MFKFNFDTSKPEDDAAAAPEPQNVEELAPSQEVTPAAEVGPALAISGRPQHLTPHYSSVQPSNLQWDAIDLSDSVIVFKVRDEMPPDVAHPADPSFYQFQGRVTDADASKALKNSDVLNSDLIPGKYEGE
jgi:hypothetical protein